MDEIFGRVTAILFAVAVFTGMPLLYMSERAKSADVSSDNQYRIRRQYLQYRFSHNGNVPAVLQRNLGCDRTL